MNEPDVSEQTPSAPTGDESTEQMPLASTSDESLGLAPPAPIGEKHQGIPEHPLPRVSMFQLLVRAALFSMGAMAMYFLLEYGVHPSISTWTSKLATIIFSTIAATGGAYLAFRKLNELYQQLIDEAARREYEANERSRAEHALRETTEQFKVLFENASDAIAIQDTQGRYLEANSLYCERLGYSRRELLKMSLTDIVSPEYSGLIAPHMEEIRKYGRAIFETAHRQRDGSVIPIEVSACIIQFAGQAAILNIARDITERRRIEANQYESKEQLRATFEQAAVGMSHVTPEGRFLRVNQKLCDIVGYTADELLERSFQELTHPDDLEADLESVRQVLADQRKTFSMEKRYFRKDGSLVWINLSTALVRYPTGEPRYFTSVIEDISQRKRAEAALQVSEARYRTVSELTSDFAFAMGILPDGSPYTEWATDAFTRITGYTTEELDQQGGWARLVYQEDRPKANQMIETVLKGQPVVAEIRLLTRPGELRWVRFHGRPGWDAAKQQVIRILGAGQDITEYKQFEAEAIRAERLAAMGQVTATLAHEIKNPLQSLQGNLELLSNFPLEADERQESLWLCQQEVRRLMDITQNVLSLSRLRQDKYQPLSIAQVCQRTVELMAPAIQKAGVRLSMDVPDNLPQVEGSSEQLAQVLINLILNSIESLPGGGGIQITAQAESDRLELHVTNDGPLIPPEHLEVLFEPFFTTKPEGNGLGLFVCHHIMQQHGGVLHAANLPDGDGVRFTMTLPIALEAVRR